MKIFGIRTNHTDKVYGIAPPTGLVKAMQATPVGSGLQGQWSALGTGWADYSALRYRIGIHTATGTGYAIYAGERTILFSTSAIASGDAIHAGERFRVGDGTSSGSGFSDMSALRIKDGALVSLGTGDATTYGLRTIYFQTDATGTGNATSTVYASRFGISNATGLATALSNGTSDEVGDGFSTGIGTSTMAVYALRLGNGDATGIGIAAYAAERDRAAAAAATGTGDALSTVYASRLGIISSTGLGTAAASAVTTEQGAASSTGIGTASVAGERTAAGASSSTGIGTSTMAAERVKDGAMVAAGVGTAASAAETTEQGIMAASGIGTAAGAALRTTVGAMAASGVGTSTMAATTTEQGAMAASGVGTASSDGEKSKLAAMAASGVGTATSAAVTTEQAAMVASGVGTATSAAITIEQGTSASAGVATAAASSTAERFASASANSVGTSSSAAAITEYGTMAASGVGTASAAAELTKGGAAAASGVGTASSAAVTTELGITAASGIGTATTAALRTAVGAMVASGVGTATSAAGSIEQGAMAASGVGTATSAATRSAVGVSSASGIGTATSAATITSSGSSSASGVGTGSSDGDRNIVFTMAIDTTKAGSANDTMVLPWTPGTYDTFIDWGDGTTQYISNGNETSHTYASTGVYDIHIRGEVIGHRFDTGTDYLKVLDIKRWPTGTYGVYNNFKGCANLNVSATGVLQISFADPYQFFNECTSLTNPGKVTAVNSGTNFWRFYRGCTALTGGVYTGMVTSKVDRIDDIFRDNTGFIESPEGWDTSEVTTIFSAFLGTDIKTIPAYDFGKVTTAWNAFYNCSLLTGMPTGLNFSACENFDGAWIICSALSGFPHYDMSAGTGFYRTWENCGTITGFVAPTFGANFANGTQMLNGSRIPKEEWNAILTGLEAVATGTGISLHGGTSTYKGIEAINAREYLETGLNWTITDGGLEGEQFGVMNATGIGNGAGSGYVREALTMRIDTTKSSPNTGFQVHFSGSYADGKVLWGDGNSSDVTGTGVYAHGYASTGIYDVSLAGRFDWIRGVSDTPSRQKVTDIVQWGDTDSTNWEYRFGYMNNLTGFPTGAIPNVEEVTQLIYAFRGCSSIVEPPTGLLDNFTQTFGAGWMNQGLFWFCSSIEKIPAGFFDNCTGWKAYAYTFANCTALTGIPSGLFDAAGTNIRDFTACFATCPNITDIDPTLFEFNNPTKLDSVFNSAVINTVDYSAMLNNLSGNATETGVLFHAGTSLYNGSAIAAHDYLVDTLGWTITDGGLYQKYATGNATGIGTATSSGYRTEGFDTGTAFTFVVDTTNAGTANDTFRVATDSAGTYNCTVKWGDGNSDTITTWNDTAWTHQYASTGVYTIQIGGPSGSRTFSKINFLGTSGTDKQKILEITNWGDTAFDTFSTAFQNCINLTGIPQTSINPGSATSMQSMFRFASIKEVPSGFFDLCSGITDIDNVFEACDMTSLPSGFFTGLTSSNIGTITYGFSAVPLTTLPENLFDPLTGLTSLIGTFRSASFTGIPSGIFELNTSISNFDNVFQNVDLDTANYGNLLQNLRDNNTNTSVNFHGGTSQYKGIEAINARATLTDTRSWTITDGGIEGEQFGISNATGAGTATSAATLFDASAAFVMDIDTTQVGSANDTFIIPTVSGAGYNCEVDWGDGNFNTITTWDDSNWTHQYSATGLYTVRIQGQFDRIFFNNAGDADKLISISNWGTGRFTSMSDAFQGCDSLTGLPTNSGFRTNGLTNATDMFWSCEALAAIPEVLFNYCSGLTTVFRTFRDCDGITNIPSGLFANCSSITNFSSVFQSANNLTGVPDNIFRNNTGATNMSIAFSATAIPAVPSGFFSGMSNCTNFNQTFAYIPEITSVHPEVFNDATGADDFALVFNQSDINTTEYSQLLENLAANNTNTSVPFHGGTSQYKGIDAINARATLTDTRSWTITDGGIEGEQFGTSNSTGVGTAAVGSGQLNELFEFTVDTTQAGTVNTNFTFPVAVGTASNYDCFVSWGDDVTEYKSTGTSWSHDYAATGIYRIRIRGKFMGPKFDNDPNSDQKITSLDRWGTGQMNTLNDGFYGCSNMEYNAPDVLQLNNTAITNMDNAFRNCDITKCPKIDVIGGPIEPDYFMYLCNLVTGSMYTGLVNSNWTRAYYSFRDVDDVVSWPAEWDFSNVDDMDYCFYDCAATTGFPTGWDLSNVTRFVYTWRNCGLTEFPAYNLTGATNVQGAWYSCLQLTNFPDVNLINATQLTWAWRECTGLTGFPSMNLPQADDMQGTWRGCGTITGFGNVIITGLTVGTNMLLDSKIPESSWDFMLTGIEAITTTNSVSFHGGTSNYSATAAGARGRLTGDHSWTITDGGGNFEEMKMTFDTTLYGLANDEVDIYVHTGTQDLTIDWGDGNEKITTTGGLFNHTYSATGVYQVALRGPSTGLVGLSMAQAGGSENERLISIDQWGGFVWTRGSGAFQGCGELTGIKATDTLNIDSPSASTDYWSLFGDCSKLKNTPNMNFTGTGGYNLYQFFHNCGEITGWTTGLVTSKVVDLNRAFRRAGTGASGPSVHPSEWDMSNVTGLYLAFGQAKVTGYPTGWDLSEAVDIESAWSTNTSLTTFPAYNLTGVTNASWAWSSCSAITSFPDVNLANCQNYGSTWSNIGTVTGFVAQTLNTGMTGAGNMLGGTTDIPIIEYSNMLYSLSGTARTGVTLGGGSNTYDFKGKLGRDDLTGNNWTITDGGMSVPFSYDIDTSWGSGDTNLSGFRIWSDDSSIWGQHDFDAYVEWGDGNWDHITGYNDTANREHQYSTSGIYTIKIWHKFADQNMSEGIGSNGDGRKIHKLNSWGEIEWLTLRNAMAYTEVTGATGIDTTPINTDVITGGGLFFLGNFSSVPEDILYKFPNMQDCGSIFRSNTLTGVPSGLLSKQTGATVLSSIFDGNNFATIPENIFSKNTEVTTFYSALGGSDIESVPSGLFSNNTKVTTFERLFYLATSLTTTGIPENLFSQNTGVTDFSLTFRWTNITSIPSGIFSENTNAKDFRETFYGVDTMTGAPPYRLFWNNDKATGFFRTLYDCDSLTEIPSGFFKNQTGVTSFEGCFQLCTGLTGVHSGLFENCTAVTNFADVFNGVTLNTQNYSDLLNNLSGNMTNTGVSFHGGNSLYNSSATGARDYLTGTLNWTITDGGAA
jgi:hypothetical protein